MITRYASLSTVLLTTLLFSGCGLTGTDSEEAGNEAPEWAGNWEVTEIGGEPAEGETTYWDLSTEAFTYITEDSGAEGCFTDTDDVLEVDGNVVTTISGNVAIKARHEVAGGTLTVTFPESDRDQITAKAVEDDPRDLAGCEK